jgi:DNA (cytosine-5)-methyltransferase 1
MSVFYTDNDGRACAWLRQLIEAGLLPAGVVHEGNVEQLSAQALSGCGQVHL